MCGICGVFDYGKSHSTFDESLLIRMSDTMKHRGPDDAGTYVSPDAKLGFGFRRLSIIDLSSAAHQPMSTPDGSVTVIFNGEIYNHKVLRRDLEAKGYRYRSKSDTESLLYAYQEYGTGLVHKLLGMFAFAIWDNIAKRLFLARDRIGVKPLYYRISDGTLVFGSEIKAILAHPSVSRELDEEAMVHYLTFLASPAPLTLFRGIRKLRPGHFLLMENNGGSRVERYWDAGGWPNQPTIDLDGSPTQRSVFQEQAIQNSEEEHAAALRTLLRQSIKDRMMSDVPFGVFLSGGIDSSMNVALMAKEMSRPVDTFTVGFKGLEKYNELDEARKVAALFRTNHHEVMVDERSALEFLPRLVYHQDEPLADPVCIPLYFVSKLARDSGTTVVQVGEGSDELFAGYPSMKRDVSFYKNWWRPYCLLPHGLRKSALRAAEILPLRGKYLLALDYLRRGTENQEFFWGSALNFTESHKRRLFAAPWDTAHDAHQIVRRWHERFRHEKSDYLRRMAYIELQHRLPELLLMRVDKMAMAASVEARVPFLDHRLVEYAMNVPGRLKIRNGTTKYILKKAVEGILPPEIIHRKKKGFDAPVNEWLRTSWSAYVEHTLGDSFLIKRGVMTRETIQTLIRSHRASGQREEGLLVWNLLNLTLWYNQWVGQKPV